MVCRLLQISTLLSGTVTQERGNHPSYLVPRRPNPSLKSPGLGTASELRSSHRSMPLDLDPLYFGESCARSYRFYRENGGMAIEGKGHHNIHGGITDLYPPRHIAVRAVYGANQSSCPPPGRAWRARRRRLEGSCHVSKIASGIRPCDFVGLGTALPTSLVPLRHRVDLQIPLGSTGFDNR